MLVISSFVEQPPILATSPYLWEKSEPHSFGKISKTQTSMHFLPHISATEKVWEIAEKLDAKEH